MSCSSELHSLNQERAKVSMGLGLERWENPCRSGCVAEKERPLRRQCELSG